MAIRNNVAAILSIAPGLGHIYKGHYVHGAVLLIFGTPLMIWVALLVGFATLGIGGILAGACYWGLVALHAYLIADKRTLHVLPD